VRDFLLALPDIDRAEMVAAMDEVAELGMTLARHLRGDIYEVRAVSGQRAFRILFAEEGRFSQVLLALVAIVKKSQRTPDHEIELALQRLRDWRQRGTERDRQ